jgi:hypothetical protein
VTVGAVGATGDQGRRRVTVVLWARRVIRARRVTVVLSGAVLVTRAPTGAIRVLRAPVGPQGARVIRAPTGDRSVLWAATGDQGATR